MRNYVNCGLNINVRKNLVKKSKWNVSVCVGVRQGGQANFCSDVREVIRP